MVLVDLARSRSMVDRDLATSTAVDLASMYLGIYSTVQQSTDSSTSTAAAVDAVSSDASS